MSRTFVRWLVAASCGILVFFDRIPMAHADQGLVRGGQISYAGAPGGVQTLYVGASSWTSNAAGTWYEAPSTTITTSPAVSANAQWAGTTYQYLPSSRRRKPPDPVYTAFLQRLHYRRTGAAPARSSS